MTASGGGGAAEFFEELRREYLLEAPARLGELRKDLAALQGGEADAANSLKVRFHRLAGSGGSYGFPDISTRSREAERWILANPSPAPDSIGPLAELIGRIATAFDEAAATLGLPTSAPKPAAFGWNATIIGDQGPATERIHAALVDGQYRVKEQPLSASPGDTPVSERPDVAVIVAAEVGAAADVVQRWAAASSQRPTVVVLVASEQVDPLRPPFSSLDAVISPERVETELLSWVRAVGRSATAPRSVLIVDRADQEATQSLVRALEGANVRVAVRDGGLAARDALLSETPDLVVVAWQPGDAAAGALLRWLHRQPAHRLTPVVVSLPTANETDRVAALQAGADDAFAKSAAPALVCQLLLARIERSRAVRAVAHRDDLTGLLNHEAMVEELDRAVNFARRTNEALAFLTIDLDHFRRVNEHYGPVAGDAILVQVSRLVVGAVRSSDPVARMGGEEIGVLVRRCKPADARRVAEKIHAAIGDSPCRVADQDIVVRASIGVACHPDHGFGAADLLRAADRALASAKAGGRDRVVIATSADS